MTPDPTAPAPSAAEAATRLLAALDVPDPPVPLAVGVVADGETATAFSQAGTDDGFELGSITKTMTAQVLASLAVAGVVRLEDPIGRWLDAGPNSMITLEALATHSSGLPRLASNCDDGAGFDELDPYAAYTAELAEAALRETDLGEVGQVAYSNFGYQVLGLALERAAGRPLSTLLDEHVFVPFGLRGASIGSHPRQVQGHRRGTSTPPWRLLLPGPGGVIGTVADLLAWGQAVVEPPAGHHGDALRLALLPRIGAGTAKVGLAWHHSDDLTWHAGGTAGFHACLIVHPARHRVAASLVATGDLIHAEAATSAAATGRDPMETRPEPGGEELHPVAEHLTDLLAANDWAGAQAAMSDECRSILTAEVLSQAWHAVMGPRGPVAGRRVRGSQRLQEMTVVTIDLDLEGGAGWAVATFDADGDVVGLRIG